MKKLILILSTLIFSSFSYANSDKNLTNIIQNSLESEASAPNITRLKPSVPNFSKEEKLVYLNIATTVGLLAYGFEHWGYDILHTKPHARSEDWFEKNSKHGGADKFGHAYSGYLASHLFSYAYEDWGYGHEQSALNGAISSSLFTTIMEMGDAFSNYGLSYEDMISNTVGSILGYYTYRYREFGEKFDYRVEYKIYKDMYEDDFTTDYENIKYIFALKGSGFDSFRDNHLRYLEVYLGYTINGFDEEPFVRERDFFVGIGINFSKLFGSRVFNYYQVPDSYLQ
ncbi:DUF2279 domain-containing protein [Sulfurovum sp. bin170]|uniref:DUF2279 domain-containing protein n=1 Tax=Sulfurovum sp. bin170 TaxID=2695268 RepID=UPI0013DEE663|nr:DUF2279 domain-containing protein [Sulfurovum sp. bin170]NEW61515.1 DUF2279 domain-containing protein [Sulfurovum sp. bin170]